MSFIGKAALLGCFITVFAALCRLNSYAEETKTFAAADVGQNKSYETTVSEEDTDSGDAFVYSLENETEAEAAAPPGSGNPDSGVSVELIETDDDASEKKGTVSMEASYGFHNTAKSGRMLPVYVDIKNDTDKDISGELVIEVQGSTETDRNEFESAAVRYSFDTEIPAGIKKRIKNTISASETGSEAKLTLYNNKGEALCGDTLDIAFRSGSGTELLVGILSDSPEKLDYFKNIGIAGSTLRTGTVELDPVSMPESVSGLEQLDILLISNFDTAYISDEAKTAIANWTENGGILLIGTGKSSKAARELGKKIKDLGIGDASERSVNMGLKYSKTNPDDAELSLNVCSVFAADGIQVMQSDDIAMLTTVQSGSGVIGIAAYDFCDIREFCTEEQEYAEDILKGLMGSSRIVQMSNSAGGSNALYSEAETLVGIADPDRLPSAAIYVLFSLFYLGLIGVGIYVYLRMRGLAIFYHAFVPIAAFMSAIFLWLISSGLRNDGISMDYAVIRELHDGYMQDTGFMKLSSASLKKYSLNAPPEYELHPIVHEAGNGGAAESVFDFIAPGHEANSDNEAVIEIKNSNSGVSVSADGMKPFAGILTEYSARHKNDNNEGIYVSANCFDDSISGSIKNNTGYNLKNAVIMMYGGIVKAGDINAGEEIKLDDAAIVQSPVGISEYAAKKITGADIYDRGSADYVRGLRRERIFSRYMNNFLCGYFQGARLIAFADGVDIMDDINSDSRIESRGIMLISASADISFEKGNNIRSICFETEPKVISGDYDAASNTAGGTCILEYALGNEINVNKLYFRSLDAEFENEGLTAFAGTAAFYNYETGVYDIMGSGIYTGVSGDALLPYLSPGNTITVRYTSDDIYGEKKRAYLPVPYAVGTERY